MKLTVIIVFPNEKSSTKGKKLAHQTCTEFVTGKLSIRTHQYRLTLSRLLFQFLARGEEGDDE